MIKEPPQRKSVQTEKNTRSLHFSSSGLIMQEAVNLVQIQPLGEIP